MAKRRNNILLITGSVIVLALIIWLMTRGEKYTPGDTKFFDSEIPTDATIIQPGELTKGKKYETPNGKYYLLFENGGNLVWVENGKETLWSLESGGAGSDAKARLLSDGNLCVIGKEQTICGNSDNTEVPKGRHLLILKNDGRLYLDSGGGTRETYNFYPQIDDYRGETIEEEEA